ncbi:MAG: methylglyoxal synthase [Firmicutes bacterium]|nr:methylglyoxal synthase [Dethiobacter sp.]MBS3889818.1 methylglyoxal synthase [Bacillota bacterium]MBS4054327.1 methylglyoxal synthase [Thermaerobacter sp.]
MRIALIAHDKKKLEMVELVVEYRAVLAKHQLVATETTGTLLKKETGLAIERVLSGPQGGDAQISAMVATKATDMVIFLRDSLTAQPHEPDITALLRICDVHKVPLATNLGTAKIILSSLARE